MNEDDFFVTPDGNKYDMTVSNYAESRVHEIETVNRAKMPELVATFSKACFALGRILPQVHLGKALAEREVARRKAILSIDVIPGKMTEKKLSSNETNRQALLDVDEEYSAAVERELRFEAALMYLRLKHDDMEGALNAVKKAVADNEKDFYRPNYNAVNTNMDAPQDWPKDEWDLQEPQVPVTSTGLKIGKAKY
jgi:hypothetical protein